MTDEQAKQPISAEPTKSFFVDMLTRDIALEQAVLDLVDNSVDGAKALKDNGPLPFDGRKIQIKFSKEKFEIFDNCGGFDSEAARTYAFRFGSPHGRKERTPHSIGQFGVGMKRALFKFGNHFVVRSATTNDSWSVDVKVPEWEEQVGWTFPWGTYVDDDKISKEKPGTDIVVTELKPEVATRFSTKLFENTILAMIKSKHRQFIAGGLSITVNDQHIDATSLYLLVADDAKFRPGVDEFDLNGVKVRIIVGVAHSAPREAGWYVICNGRVILEADRSNTTGWGMVEDANSAIVIPSYHNQFSRFRGIVSFDSNDSALVPWNTTKTDVDQDSSIWQKTYMRMTEMMRPVINFLNELDRDIDEHTKDNSPLLSYVSSSASVKPEDLKKADFIAPARGTLSQKIKTVKIQYSKPLNQVNHLMKELSLSSAKSVGEKTFELTYKEMGGE